MNRISTKLIPGPFKDYFFLLLCTILAYLPVSSMAFALKNDIIVLEYPIKYFISQCIHNGIKPLWFNTWALGFPLESFISWSAHSPLQMIFSLFNYNLYTLHLEFLVYIFFSGCTMLYFLRKHISADKEFTWIIACCYMLSGFNVSSSQWLLYITASGFVPLVICLLIDLFKNPGWKSAFLFSIALYTMLTSVYAAFNIITCYIILATVLYFLITKSLKSQSTRKNLFFLTVSLILGILLITPGLLSTLTILNSIERGAPISDISFFNSNYLHPNGLLSIVLPLSSIRPESINTEGSMMHSYIGLLPVLLLPISVISLFKNHNNLNLILFVVTLIFLLLSLGPLTPLRQWSNILPGFSYFRNAGLFRVFTLFFLLLYLARYKSPLTKLNITITLLWGIVIGVFYLTMLVLNFQAIQSIKIDSGVKYFVQNITREQALLISSCIQLLILIVILFLLKNQSQLLNIFIALELIINTLICTPFFTVGSYSVKETARIFQTKKGFPVQSSYVDSVPTYIKTNKANWYHLNIYQKEISAQPSYWGPLVLKEFKPLNKSTEYHYNNKILFTDLSATISSVSIQMQKPDLVSAVIKTDKPVKIHFLQNYFKGWNAFFNTQKQKIHVNKSGGMFVTVASNGVLEFKYQNDLLWICMLIINGFVFIISLYYAINKILFIKSSSPSVLR